MERTLAIMKPDCVQKNLVGKVVDKILANGFRILALKMIRLSVAQAQAFYDVHRGKAFYDELVDIRLFYDQSASGFEDAQQFLNRLPLIAKVV